MSEPTTDLSVLPTSGNPNNWSPEQAQLMEFAGVGHAPASVAQGFLHACARTGLDPIAKQIYAMQFKGKWAVIVGVDGFRVIAQRSKGYQGQVGPQFTADGVTWSDAWLPTLQGGKANDVPMAARVGVWREGFREPLWQVITWAEFGQTTGNWNKTPAHMLGIRAETHALRRAFPNDLSGLYTAEDFDGQDDAEIIEPSRDWAALIAAADDKAVLADLLVQMREAGDWTQELNARVAARAGVVVKDSRPPKAAAAAAPAAPNEDVYEPDGTPAGAPVAEQAPAGHPDDGLFPEAQAGAGGYIAPGDGYAAWLAENPDAPR